MSLIAEVGQVKNLPSEVTSFIGRKAEIAEITALLNKPTCRLLTLLGPGGIGKTRLATQVASQLADGYAHGVWFISLQSVQTPGSLTSAIVDGLNFPLTGQEDLFTQLLRYLKGKELLLLLDNFEQLLVHDGASIVENILAGTSEIRMVVTSRETLNLLGEWIYSVKGLSSR